MHITIRLPAALVATLGTLGALATLPACTSTTASSAAPAMAIRSGTDAGIGQDLPAPAAVLATMERVADWQLAHPSPHAPDDWTQGVGDAGFMALSNLAPTHKYRDAMVAMGERNGFKPGARTYHADDHVVGQTYAELYLQLREPAMIAPLRARFDEILAHPRTGALDFKAPGNQERWSWCDALFMGAPAWVRMSAATGDPRYLEHAVAEWWTTSDFLYDPKEHLYYRDSTYFDRREANGAKVFWARGNGWVMGGLARTLQYLPANHPARARFETQFREMAAKVASLQRPDGLWRASLLDPNAYPARETSGTGLFTYALAWGVNQGLLDRARYEPVVRRAWTSLAASVAPDGKLTHVQPIGSAPDGFPEDSTEVYGVGAFLMAGSEVFRMGVQARAPAQAVLVTNPGGFYRSQETIEVNAPRAPVVAMDAATSRILPTQRVGATLLFQADFAPGEGRRFLLFPTNALPPQAAPDVRVHARHVSERYDDFAWESDRIAHRLYGPAILKVPSEHVGSGIDVWVKRVRTPIVDLWYKRGEYHTDHGEGLDNYDVGTGRGCGGEAIISNGKAYPAPVYSTWRLLADGPLRAAFELRYDGWDAGGRQVSETKRFSIDAGSNFTRVESVYTSADGAPLEVGVGISQRKDGKGDGRLSSNQAGWMSYWQPEQAPNGHTACAVAIPGQRTRTARIGEDALLLGHASPGKPFVHYLGAGWSKSGDTPDAAAWEAQVARLVVRAAEPLVVSMPVSTPQ
jgi:unsaturated rhamnogalacturonyl hydrolase